MSAIGAVLLVLLGACVGLYCASQPSKRDVVDLLRGRSTWPSFAERRRLITDLANQSEQLADARDLLTSATSRLVAIEHAAHARRRQREHTTVAPRAARLGS